MKKLLLGSTLSVAGILSANSSTEKFEMNLNDNSGGKTLIIFELSCKTVTSSTDKDYSDQELIVTYVGLEEMFCGKTVDPKDIVVER